MASTLETNKVLAALLTAGIVASGAGVFSRIIYSPETLEEPVYVIAVAEPTDAEPADDPGVEPIAVRLAAAGVEEGEAAARPCVACHSFEPGGPNQVGPVLWDVVGRDIASVSGFNYSDALAQMDGVWDYEALDQFIADPRGFAPGTRMAFAGVRSPQDRADIVSYMRSLSDNPEPLPEVTEAPAQAASEEAAPEGEAPATAEGEAAATAEGEAPATAEGEAPVSTEGEQAAAAEPETAQAGDDAAGVETLVAQADPAAGEQAARKCVACHSFEQGGPNKIGPALWDVVGRDIAALEGFSYSDALAQKEGAWDDHALDAFLANPREWAPGTKMAFAGVRTPEERAEIIAYLRSMSENPPPLPGG